MTDNILFDEQGAGVFLGGPDNPVSPRTMQRWRLEGVGPAFVKIGPRLVRYRRSELDAFLDGRVCQSTSEQSA